MIFNPFCLIRSNRMFLLLFLGFLCSGPLFGQERHFPKGAHDIYIANVKGVRSPLLENIAPIIETSIANGHYPGAVILIGHRGKIIYRGVFGNKRLLPNAAPMRFDTIFDIASLTKVMVTTTAIMQLVEQGKIDIDKPVAAYWPQFAAQNKNSVTIRELLTHTSGLPAGIINQPILSNKSDSLKRIAQLRLVNPPGTKFLYSDVGFIVLAYLVEVISKEPIDIYAKNHIFKPLNMTTTFFAPKKALRDRIAPTELIDNKLRWGEVHDPLAYSLGGVSGNAGVFSTANDLGRYAQSLLDGGKLPQFKNRDTITNHFLSPLSITKMTTPQTPSNLVDIRGFGWDIDSPYSNRGILFTTRSYGHTGWTGTSIWIDPVTQTWIVILTSRTHPHPLKDNQLVFDRRTIANIVSASIVDISTSELTNTGRGELYRAYRPI
jgi:serine-type D-Ala-D-Ala carboxypeptidase